MFCTSLIFAVKWRKLCSYRKYALKITLMYAYLIQFSGLPVNLCLYRFKGTSLTSHLSTDCCCPARLVTYWTLFTTLKKFLLRELLHIYTSDLNGTSSYIQHSRTKICIPYTGNIWEWTLTNRVIWNIFSAINPFHLL